MSWPLAPGQFVPEPQPWLRVALPSLLLGAMLTAVYWGILRDLGIQWWDDANYNHGFLVPLFSAFLVWRERDRLRAEVPTGSFLGIPVLLAGIVARRAASGRGRSDRSHDTA